MTLEFPRGTTEYVVVEVTADETLDMTVAISITTNSTHTWLPAQWVGSAGTTRECRTVDPVEFDSTDYPAGGYAIYVKLTDNPEVPFIRAGHCLIT